MNFRVLYGNIATIERQVQDHLDNGWELHGPLLVYSSSLVQTMTKPKDPVVTEERQVEI